MFSWETKRAEEIVADIDGGTYALLAVHTGPAWDETAIELLFDSLLTGHPFGSMTVLQEDRSALPLFASRRFSRAGEADPPRPAGTLDRTTNLVMDGRQRLQALYTGLLGTYEGRTLRVNLLSEPASGGAFRFAAPPGIPDGKVTEDGGLWYGLPGLFDRLRRDRDHLRTAHGIAARGGITNVVQAGLIAANVHRFFSAVFVEEAVGIAVVRADHTRRGQEQARIIELFLRLHSGETPLPALVLAELEAARIPDPAALPDPIPSGAPGHPILSDQTPWQTVYAATGSRDMWTERYVSELRRNRIETVADFARWIMQCGLVLRKKQRQGAVYRFRTASPDGFLPDLRMNEFGGWAWKVALLELADRGFDWLEYVAA